MTNGDQITPNTTSSISTTSENKPLANQVTPSAIDRSTRPTKEDLDKLNHLIVGVTIFFAVSFIIAIITFILDIYRDNSIYDKFIEQVRNDSSQYEGFIEKINESNVRVESLKKEFELLRAKNQYLR